MNLLFLLASLAQSAPSGAEARTADLRAFRADFLAKDNSYSAAAKQKAEARLTRLESAVDTISQVQLDLELARIVALADNGHTAYYASSRSRRYNRVPVRLAPFGGQFYVLDADSANASLVGAELIAIDGREIGQAIAAGRSFTGGTEPWRDRSVPYLLESPEQLHALHLAKQPGSATYRFVLPGGQRVDRNLVAAVSPDANPWPGRWLYRQPNPVWAFRDAGTPFRWRAAPELEAMVIELRQTYNAPDLPIRKFLDSMRAEIGRQAPRNLVLDLRMNGGGDLNTTRDFLKGLPAMIPGRIFVLTSPWTFSAAISSTGYLKQASPERVTIVGEMVGDRPEFWSEGRGITLPSGGMIGSATQRHDYKNGCRAYTDCHGPVVRNPISVPTLAPEIVAPWTIEAWRSGRDPGMEAIAAALGRAPRA